MDNRLGKRLKEKKGFTLLEMIVVIGLIVLLAGFGMFKYAQIQENAREQLDIATARTIYDATVLALSQNKLESTASSTTTAKLKELGYLVKDVKAQSKKYKGSNGSYSVAIQSSNESGDADITISANGHTLIPEPSQSPSN